MAPVSRYLGLDLGTKSGFCLVEDDKIVHSGTWDFSKYEHSGRRGIKFYNLLQEMGRVDEVYYEKVQFTGGRKNGKSWSGDHGELYKGLLMLVNMYAYSYRIPTFGIFPTTLKKNFCGHGGAEKADMCAVARAMGWDGSPTGSSEFNDEVDAIALLVTELRLRYGVAVKFPK